jgi:hypothetical protein
LDAEVLIGHFLNYYKPTPGHLGELFGRALEAIAIDEKYTLREELQKQESEHKEAWKDVRLELLTEGGERAAQEAAGEDVGAD